MTDRNNPSTSAENLSAEESSWSSAKGGHFSLEDFEIGKPLGSGKYGKVYMARMKENHFIVAIKVLFKSKLIRTRSLRQLEREIENQRHLEHPNIAKMYTFFWDEKKVYLVLELAPNGDVYEKLYKLRRFPEPMAAKYIHDIADALQYCHSQDIIHRDIKLENLLLGPNDEVKIADFGLSVHSPSDRRQTCCGTAEYMAPEIINGQEYGKAVDLWAIGVLLFEFVTGGTPFDHDEREEKNAAIREARFNFPKHVSQGARDLINSLIVVEPDKRISLQGVINNEWVQKMLEVFRA